MSMVECRRIGKKIDNKSRVIVCTVATNVLRNSIVFAKKKTIITAADFNFKGNNHPWGTKDDVIFIDEHLTRENRMLFIYARKLKALQYKYIWTYNGRIFIRRTEQDSAKLVKDITVIDDILSHHMQETGQ